MLPVSSYNPMAQYAPPALGGSGSSSLYGQSPLQSPLSGGGLNMGVGGDTLDTSGGNLFSGALGGGSSGLNASSILPMLLQMMSMMMTLMMSLLGGQGSGASSGLSPSSMGSNAGDASAPAPSSSGGAPAPSATPSPASLGGAPAPTVTPSASNAGSAASPAPPSSTPSPGGSPVPSASPSGANAAGQSNVAGQGNVDPNKPIYVPIVNGKYDMNALDALAKQGLNGIDPNSALDNTNKGGDPGQTTNDNWTIANGPLAGIKNGAAIAWGCYKNGYTSNDDLLNAAAVASVESRNSINNGQSNGSGYTQSNSDIFAPNTGGAQGLFQLDPHWNSTQDAFNPFVNSIRAISLMKKIGNGSSIAHDAPTYNTGDPNATYATAQGGYHTIPGIVSDNDNALRSQT